ncbi:hypothetical protein ACFLVW_05590 [Chloroflexota bacterium]
MPFRFERRKVKITKEEFVELLTYWLSMPMSKGSIAIFAQNIGFNIGSKKNIDRLTEKLFMLYMWVIVRACDRLIDDAGTRNSCLDIFHRTIYSYRSDATDEGFRQWMLVIGSKYLNYDKAMEKTEEPGPLWWLARLVNKNIFGKVKEDPFVQTYIGANISSFTEYVESYLSEALKKSDIE